jgi:hypothetical protein
MVVIQSGAGVREQTVSGLYSFCVNFIQALTLESLLHLLTAHDEGRLKNKSRLSGRL